MEIKSKSTRNGLESICPPWKENMRMIWLVTLDSAIRICNILYKLSIFSRSSSASYLCLSPLPRHRQNLFSYMRRLYMPITARGLLLRMFCPAPLLRISRGKIAISACQAAAYVPQPSAQLIKAKLWDHIMERVLLISGIHHSNSTEMATSTRPMSDASLKVSSAFNIRLGAPFDKQ